jgi:hypothetical protein
MICSSTGESLAQTILAGLKDTERMAQMAAAGKNYVQQFDSRKTLAQFEQVLISVVPAPAGQLEVEVAGDERQR